MQLLFENIAFTFCNKCDGQYSKFVSLVFFVGLFVPNHSGVLQGNIAPEECNTHVCPLT